MLLLFDIDGTLLLKASAEHEAALVEAICSVHRITPPEGRVETAGRTDPAIARALLTLAGVDARRVDDRMEELRAATCEAYARRCPEDLTGTVSLGMAEILEHLVSAGHVLSLVTGNYEAVARLKLRRRLFKRRCHLTARAAPRCPKVDQHGYRAAPDVALECCLIQCHRMARE